MATISKPTYKSTFVQADEDGDYVDMGRQYTVTITDDEVAVAKHRIPLLKVHKVEHVGNGVAITFFDANKVPAKVVLTTSNFFGIAIGRAKRLDELVEVLESAVHSAKTGASAEAVALAQDVAPPDTCHDCGARGGAPLEFGEIWSVVVLSRWSSIAGVYCKKHATIRGLRYTLISGSTGWWSPWGVFITPVYLVRNIGSLWSHSNVPKVVVFILATAAFIPAAVIFRIVKSW